MRASHSVDEVDPRASEALECFDLIGVNLVPQGTCDHRPTSRESLARSAITAHSDPHAAWPLLAIRTLAYGGTQESVACEFQPAGHVTQAENVMACYFFQPKIRQLP